MCNAFNCVTILHSSITTISGLIMICIQFSDLLTRISFLQLYVRWSSFIPISNILSIRSRNSALLLESNTFGNLLTENSLAKVYLLTPFWFSSLLPISLFSFSSSLYSLTFLMSLLFLSLPCPFLFSSFLLLCLTVCFSTFFLSLLHLAPLKVFTNDAAQNLRVERSQHSLQDCRMMEFEASNKVIPVL